MIISVIELRMLFPKGAAMVTSSEGQHELEIAFTPIAMPSLAGPGSLSMVITAASLIKGNHPEQYALVYFGVVVGMAITVLVAFLILRASGSLARVLGSSGIDAMTRIFGFLLVAIGVQVLLTGVSGFFGLSHI